MKRILIFVLILILAVFSGCEYSGDFLEKIADSSAPIESESKELEEAAPTPEPTPTPNLTPNPTPNPTPNTPSEYYEKMLISDDELEELLALWPLVNLPVDEHETFQGFSIFATDDDRYNLNVSFRSDKSPDELVKKYQMYVEGEWEEQSDGWGVHDVVDGVEFYLDILYMSELAYTLIYFAFYMDGSFSEMNEFVGFHWPYRLMDMPTGLINEQPNYVLIFYGRYSTYYTRNWELSTEKAEALYNQYRKWLKANSDYNDTGSYVSCKIGDVEIMVSLDDDSFDISFTIFTDEPEAIDTNDIV